MLWFLGLIGVNIMLNIDEIVTIVFLMLGMAIIMYIPFGITRSAKKDAEKHIKELGLPPETIKQFLF